MLEILVNTGILLSNLFHIGAYDVKIIPTLDIIHAFKYKLQKKLVASEFRTLRVRLCNQWACAMELSH